MREGREGGVPSQSVPKTRPSHSSGLSGRRKKSFCGGGGGGSEGGGKVGFSPPFPRYPTSLASLEVKTKVGKCGKRK